MFTSEKPELSKFNTKMLYPLWRIEYAPNKKSHVTAVAWNPRYSDLFVAAYGSYEFGKRLTNCAIALFSLKNTEFPEKVIPLEVAP